MGMWNFVCQIKQVKLHGRQLIFIPKQIRTQNFFGLWNHVVITAVT